MPEEVGKYWYGPGLVRLKKDLEGLLGISLDFDLGLDEQGNFVIWAENPAAKDLASVVSESLQDNRVESRRILCRLLYYRKHLREVAKLRPSIFEGFRGGFQESGGEQGNFYGDMFEVEVAASLARKSVIFEKEERPDFVIQAGGKSIGVECTAAISVRKESEKGPLDKIWEKIRKKGSKGYLDLSDALFIDPTGIHYASGGGGMPRWKSLEENLKREMSQGIHLKEIGAAVAFTRVVHDEGNIETVYSRVDHLRAAKSLKGFLDSAYPFGTREVDLQRVSYLEHG